MPEGVIVGGWSFVVAAYTVVGAGLALYAIHLITRLRSTRRHLAREAEAPRSARVGASGAGAGTKR